MDTGGRCTPGNGNCSDGIKNGDETGVDVGGRCLIGDPGSCVDGIKNGDETGIDTGGRCGPGVNGTCSDRIQNGDETGVDVGGRCGPGNGNCADGMRNGDETAVDYGGRCGTGRNLNVNRAAGGSVTSVDGRISCSRTLNSCSYSYNNGTNVVIDAKPASGYWKFTGWTTNPSGLCSGTSTRCSLNMTQSITVTPIFGPRIFDYREF